MKKYLGNTKTNYIVSSFIAGICASILCLPFDNMKVKIQKGAKGGAVQYKGLIDCFV